MSDTLEFLIQIHEADRAVMDRIQEALPQIAGAADRIAERLRAGGRWVYCGAGTSGRLGIVDAAELPPTFGIPEDRVIALIAGGPEAVFRSAEDAEDDAEGGARDLDGIQLAAEDAVLGIAASGTTPYVLGALRRAREIGAYTVALTCSPGTPICEVAEHSIAIHTGPEILAGSTRMKAGTAQKIALTMLSTAVMRRRGLIYAGEMVAMRATNTKLRARATRIVSELVGLETEEARALLEDSNWDLPVALIRGRFSVSADEARERLDRHQGSVAEALDEDRAP